MLSPVTDTSALSIDRGSSSTASASVETPILFFFSGWHTWVMILHGAHSRCTNNMAINVLMAHCWMALEYMTEAPSNCTLDMKLEDLVVEKSFTQRSNSVVTGVPTVCLRRQPH